MPEEAERAKPKKGPPERRSEPSLSGVGEGEGVAPARFGRAKAVILAPADRVSESGSRRR